MWEYLAGEFWRRPNAECHHHRRPIFVRSFNTNGTSANVYTALMFRRVRSIILGGIVVDRDNGGRGYPFSSAWSFESSFSLSRQVTYSVPLLHWSVESWVHGDVNIVVVSMKTSEMCLHHGHTDSSKWFKFLWPGRKSNHGFAKQTILKVEKIAVKRTISTQLHCSSLY